jgi:lipopolysaccharide assembly outer membrane protein LptD (OstA)
VDENLAWKIVYAAAIFSLLVLGLAYYLIAPRESVFFEPGKEEKIAEFKKTRVEGRKDGKKSWEFFAESGWTAKNQGPSHLYNVSRGEIYTKGKLTIRRLAAPSVEVERRAELITASGPGGKVVFRLKRDLVRADSIIIDLGRKRAYFPAEFKVIRPNGLAIIGTAEYNSETEMLSTAAGARFSLQEGGLRTRFKSDRADFYQDEDKDIALAGSLEVVQGKKLSVADEGLYSRRQNTLVMRGRTKTVLEKGGALLKAGTIAKLRGPDAKELLGGKTIVTAEQIIFSTKTGDARASGEVVVSQKGKEAKSDTAAYDDKNEVLTLSGNVFMKKGEDWLAARQVVISIGKETFEATEVKEAKFKL